MKLAEALILRADAQKRIEQLRNRLCQSTLVQEGETRRRIHRSCWLRLSG